MMKNIFYYLSFLSFLYLTSCNNSSETEDDLSVYFQIVLEKHRPNFVNLIATGDEQNAIYEWKLSDGRTLTGQNVVCYFERKGVYEVSLTKKVGSLRGVFTKKISVQENSYYFQQEEQLWWHDEFCENHLDNSAWNYDIGIGKWGNNEWQNYTNKAENSFLRDGLLVLKAMKSGEGQKEGDYTSARLTTKGKKEINRGRVEVRAKLPGGVGLWPAIWMFGTKAAPYYSELDIMEYVGCDKNIIYSAVHTSETLSGTNKVSSSKKVDDVETSFHVYGMNWTDDKIEYYLDNPSNVYLSFMPTDRNSMNSWPFDRELYLILNIAVGGDWGGMHGVDDSIFPREMEIDYVRIFKKK